MSRIKGFFVIPALALGLALGSISLAHAEDSPGEKFNEGAKEAAEKTKDGAKEAWDKTKQGVETGFDKAKEGMGKGMEHAGDGMAKAGDENERPRARTRSHANARQEF